MTNIEAASKEKLDMKKLELKIREDVNEMLFYISSRLKFYAYIISKMEKKMTDEIPIAAVSIRDYKPQLLINPVGFSAYSPKEQIFILIHEILHLSMKHHRRGRGKKPDLANIAADLEVNQRINLEHIERPKDALMPDMFNLPKDLSFEDYYKLLEEKAEQEGQIKMPNGLSGTYMEEMMSGDDVENGDAPGFEKLHPNWEKEAGKNENQENAVLKKILVRAQIKAAGDTPGGLEQIIKQLTKPEIQWPRHLRSFFTSVISTSKKSTWSRPNRRFGTMKMGNRRDYTSHFLIAVDTSASLSLDDLTKILSEIDNLTKTEDVKITFTQCDRTIQEVVDFENIDISTFKVKGGGGTSFMPVFELIEKGKLGKFSISDKPDGVIYFTDGYGEAPAASAIRTLWVLTQDGRKPYNSNGNTINWGETIQFKN